MRTTILILASTAWLAAGCGNAGGPGPDSEPQPPDAPDDVVTEPDPYADMHPMARRLVERAGEDVLVREGACPFECCVYRDWIAEGPVAVRGEPSSSADVLTTMSAGTRFDAETGFVRVTSPVAVVVTEPVEAYRLLPDSPAGGEPARFEPGDTLLVLDYVGEGYYTILRDGEPYSAQQFWPSGQGWPPAEAVAGEAYGEYEAEWWARVRTPEGVEGWIDADGSELGNVDACG